MSENEIFLIEEFLEDNYHLFAIMGVFGALSIYLINILPANDIFYQISIVASSTLFILVSLIICLKIRRKLVDMSHNVSMRGMFENLLFALFVTPLYFLIFVIAIYVFNSFPKPLEILSGFITLISGIIFSFFLLNFIEIKVKNKILYILCLIVLVTVSIIAFRYILDRGPILGSLELISFFFISSIVVVSASYLVTKLLDLVPPIR